MIWKVVFSTPISRLMRFFLRIFGQSPFDKRLKALSLKMNQATSYEDWKRAGSEIDRLTGNCDWKSDPNSTLYSFSRLNRDLKTLRKLVDVKDVLGVIRFSRSQLLRNLGGIDDAGLYNVCCDGSTKNLIQEYTSEVVSALQLVSADSTVPAVDKLSFFNETRHSFGRSAFLLSGGGGLGIYHLGVIEALREASLLPRVLCGSSVGAIIASVQ